MAHKKSNIGTPTRVVNLSEVEGTKKQFIQKCYKEGFEARYSGKDRKFYLYPR